MYSLVIAFAGGGRGRDGPGARDVSYASRARLIVVWVAVRGDGVALLVLIVGSLIIKISSKKVKKIKEHTWAQETRR